MRLLAVALLAGVLLAGCSAPPPTAAPARLSPPITADFLDLTTYRDTPCKLMGPVPLAHFYVKAPGVTTRAPAGAVCTWTPADLPSVSYQATPDLTSGGLEALYRKRSTFPLFQPVEVHTYPGVHVSAEAARPGRCTTDIAVANDSLLVVSVNYADPKVDGYADPCAEADRFAGYMIAYIRSTAP